MFKNKLFKEFNFDFNSWLIIGSSAIIFISLVISLIVSGQTSILLNKKLAETKEQDRPAELEIVVLKDSKCQDCFDVQPLVDAIKKENTKINSEKTVEVESAEGAELVSKFNIAKVPTLIVTGEVQKDPNLKALWERMGEVKDNNTFILRQVGAPYVLASSGEVKGRIKVIMLTDKSCSECYQVTNHEVILRQFGLSLNDKETIDRDSADGQGLVSKYQIKFLPTLILIGEVGAYPTLKAVWPQVGTVEKDGTYVFREGVKQMGVYIDLTTNQVVKPEANQAQGSSAN